MKNKIAALVCENYRQEFELAVKSEKFDEVDIVTFPADCHRPHMKNCSFACNALNLDGREYNGIHVFHCSNVSGLECKLRANSSCFHHIEERCFDMIAQKAMTDALLKEGAYLLTPGWLGKWKMYLAQWGMKREIAGEFFAEFARKLILIDTLVDPASADNLTGFADFVGCPSESIPVGLDFFRDHIRARLG